MHRVFGIEHTGRKPSIDDVHEKRDVRVREIVGTLMLRPAVGFVDRIR